MGRIWRITAHGDGLKAFILQAAASRDTRFGRTYPASKIAVCRANGNLTLTRLQRVGPSPQAERGEQQQFPAARESPFASPLPVREGWPAAGGTG